MKYKITFKPHLIIIGLILIYLPLKLSFNLWNNTSKSSYRSGSVTVYQGNNKVGTYRTGKPDTVMKFIERYIPLIIFGTSLLALGIFLVFKGFLKDYTFEDFVNNSGEKIYPIILISCILFIILDFFVNF